MKRVLVFGIGNYVQSDDGFGVHVIRELEKHRALLPADTELLDAGTSIVDQMSDIAAADRLICVDVVDGGGQSGTIYRFRPEDVTYKSSRFHHAHKINLFDTLEMVRHMQGKAPETTIIAIQPEHIEWGTELSDTLRAKLPEVVQIIRDEVMRDRQQEPNQTKVTDR